MPDQPAQGTKEGVQSQDDSKGVSPASIGTKPEQIASPSVIGAAQSPSQEKPEQIPFGDKRHPEYRRFKELNDNSRRANERADKLERELAEIRGWKEAQMANQRSQDGSQVDPNTRRGIVELFQMGLTIPEVKQIVAQAFGLDRLDSLHKDFSSFRETWEGNQYEAELGDVLRFSKENGLDPDDVEDELREHVSNHPFFAKRDYAKGGVWAAFRDKYADRFGEFREGAENRKRIEERERLKAGQAQSAAPASSAENQLPTHPGQRMKEMVRRAGGADKVDWSR